MIVAATILLSIAVTIIVGSLKKLPAGTCSKYWLKDLSKIPAQCTRNITKAKVTKYLLQFFLN